MRIVTKCAKEIIEVLKKYECKMYVDVTMTGYHSEEDVDVIIGNEDHCFYLLDSSYGKELVINKVLQEIEDEDIEQ